MCPRCGGGDKWKKIIGHKDLDHDPNLQRSPACGTKRSVAWTNFL